MTSNKISKKGYERILLNRFLETKSLTLSLTDIQDGDDPPDFVLYQEQKTISLEVTRLVHPDLMEKEAFQTKIVLEAQKLFNQKYDCKLNVLISFANVEISTKKKSFEIYVKEIFELIEKMYLSKKDYDFNISTNYNNLPYDYIEDINIKNLYNFDHWQTFGAFMVAKMDFNLLESKIKEKGRKASTYKGRYDENWLLISTNFGTGASTYDFWPAKPKNIRSEFEKIFIHLYQDDTAIELK